MSSRLEVESYFVLTDFKEDRYPFPFFFFITLFHSSLPPFFFPSCVSPFIAQWDEKVKGSEPTEYSLVLIGFVRREFGGVFSYFEADRQLTTG